MPTLQSHTFASRTSQGTDQSLAKSVSAQPHERELNPRQTRTTTAIIYGFVAVADQPVHRNGNDLTPTSIPEVKLE